MKRGDGHTFGETDVSEGECLLPAGTVTWFDQDVDHRPNAEPCQQAADPSFSPDDSARQQPVTTQSRPAIGRPVAVIEATEVVDDGV